MAEPRIQVVKPDPDPTLLTTENLRREIANLKELIESRISANDKSIDLIQSLILSKLDALSSVMDEKFLGVAAQFSERDTRTDQRAGDTKLAVDAAFAAAKEATAKIEAGFTKSIDGQQELMNTNTKASDEKISDLKDRITAIEARTQGMGVASQDNRSVLFGVIGAIIGVTGLLIAAGTLVSVIILRSH